MNHILIVALLFAQQLPDIRVILQSIIDQANKAITILDAPVTPPIPPPIIIPPPPIILPLIQSTNLIKDGSFQVPQGQLGNTSFEYGGNALAFNPTRNSLFIVGHDWHQLTTEISIPPFGTTARLLQPFFDSTSGRRNLCNPGDPNQCIIGGHLVVGDKLYTSTFAYYDGAGTQKVSHFVSKLSDVGNAIGPVQVGSTGYTSGPMASIPESWRAAFGGTHLTGQCCLNIVSRTSYGPAVAVFNPIDIVDIAKPVSAQSLLYYPGVNPLGAWDSNAPTLFNGNSQVKGIVFPEGTRSILFIGRHGTGPFCYATGAQCGDPVDSDKGPHGFPYVFQIWAYDALDLLAVKSGIKKPWELRPYAIWNLPLSTGVNRPVNIGGVAYDATGNRIFISQRYGNSAYPTIHVYHINK